jgi:hypothetical protein
MLPVTLEISTITLTLYTLDVRFSSQLLAADVAPSAYMDRLFPFRCMTPHWLHHTLTQTLLNVAIGCFHTAVVRLFLFARRTSYRRRVLTNDMDFIDCRPTIEVLCTRP